MITIIGATGFTGRLIVGTLKNENVPLRLCGRSQDKLEKLNNELSPPAELMSIDVSSREQVKRAMENSSVVINCAGPFTELGLIVVEEAVANGVHYLDITGEQQFIALTISRFREEAHTNNVTLIPACAFEYALGDAAADLMETAIGGLESFESTYVIEGLYTSRGTKRSVLCALESKAHHMHSGELIELDSSAISRFESSEGDSHLRFPFPGGEVYLLPLHSRVRNIKTYLTSSAPYPILRTSAFLAPIVAKTALKKLLNHLIEFSSASPARTETRFCVSARGSNSTASSAIDIRGIDPYFLTAKIAAAFALALLHEPSLPRGVVSAAMLKGGGFVREIMEREQVTWTASNT